MLQFLIVTVLALFSAAPMPAVPAADDSVVWAQVDKETEAVLALHDDLRLTLSALDVETGQVQTSTAISWVTFPQGPITGGTLPGFTTTYKDTTGATQTIFTPIVSDTDAGLEKARKLHRRLVAMMQADFPPAPIPAVGG